MYIRGNFYWLSIAGALILWPSMVTAKSDSAQTLNAKIRFMHYDRDFEDKSKDRVQNGFGFIVNYLSPQFLDYFRVGVSGHISENVVADGLQREDVFYSDNNRIKRHALLGEAYLEVLPVKGLSIKIGRQRHKSMFLVSKTRVLPSIYQGASTSWLVSDRLKLYGLFTTSGHVVRILILKSLQRILRKKARLTT